MLGRGETVKERPSAAVFAFVAVGMVAEFRERGRCTGAIFFCVVVVLILSTAVDRRYASQAGIYTLFVGGIGTSDLSGPCHPEIFPTIQSTIPLKTKSVGKMRTGATESVVQSLLPALV